MSIPDFTDAKYGYVAGPFFYLIFGTMVLFTGSFADNYSRKILLGAAAILWSCTTLGTALSTDFAQICTFRVFLGAFESFSPSCCYSLITDYFPPEIRTTANACFAGCIFVGAALSSLSVLLIGAVGWRGAFAILAIYGIISGVCVFFVIKEPKRGRYDVPVVPPADQKQPMYESQAQGSKLKQLQIGFMCLFKNPCTRWLFLGGALRFWETTVISFYCELYFDYFDKPSVYGTMNALVILCGGLTSSLMAG